jgi:hypothetical protein
MGFEFFIRRRYRFSHYYQAMDKSRNIADITIADMKIFN